MGSQPRTDSSQSRWAPAGSHASPDAKIEKQMVQHTGARSREIDEFAGSCMQCLVDLFCPGEIAPLTCTEKTDNGQLRGMSVRDSQRHGEMHPCPPGSDTRGQPGMQYCTCKPGHTGSYSIGGVDSSDCVLVPASSPGLFSPDGSEACPCLMSGSSAAVEDCPVGWVGLPAAATCFPLAILRAEVPQGRSAGPCASGSAPRRPGSRAG